MLSQGIVASVIAGWVGGRVEMPAPPVLPAPVRAPAPALPARLVRTMLRPLAGRKGYREQGKQGEQGERERQAVAQPKPTLLRHVLPLAATGLKPARPSLLFP